MASAMPSLRHLRFTAVPSVHPFSSTIFHLSPSPCCNRAFVFPCSSISLSVEPRRGASLFSRHFRLHTEKKGKLRRNVVVASLFGVGAPEALVIGVVALLVFGPKGLAEVARNLGKTLRAFQPTIRELQDVSREFKSTLEREIGFDEIAPSSSTRYNSSTRVKTNQPSVPDPNGKGAYSSEDLLEVTQEQLAASASASTSTAAATETETVEASKVSVTSDATVVSASSQATPPAETPVEATPIPTSEGTAASVSSTEKKII